MSNEKDRHAREEKVHVLIVGGGFGGVYTAKTLLKEGYRVTLVSKTNFFVFTPLLHEVATGSLNSNDVTFEYSDFFHHKNFTFFRESITAYDFNKRLVVTERGDEISYDYLVISTGAVTNFFGAVGSEFAFQLKSIEDALALKRRIVSLAQGIERDVVVNMVGGGPTGVELVFELVEFLRTIKKHSPTLKYKVRLIHAGDVLCGTFSEKIQQYALREMEREGIDVRLESIVTKITEDSVETKRGERLGGDITVWTAGVIANTQGIDESYKDEKGNVIVGEDLRILGRDVEFALGDIVTQKETVVPKLAQTAIKQGPIVGRNIHALVENRKTESYVPKVSGMLISLGKGRGAGNLFGVTFRGFLGWLIWRSAYLSKIPGFRNKIDVSFTWMINFFSSRDLFER